MANGSETFWDYVLKWDNPYTVYQSDTDYTSIIFVYSSGGGGARPHLDVMYEGVQISFRVQAVEGYFVWNDTVQHDSNAVFEGVGSEPVMFEITIPVTTGSNPKPTTTVIKPSTGVSTTSNPSSIPQQKMLQSTVIIIVLIFVGIIAILLIVITYLLCKQKKLCVHNSNTQVVDFV
ncbi:MAG: hypothetical protein LBB87_02280 [Nitrososphaerota archaeon]|nr:hypothetical protein [Nitrososphaerota archaeon]